MKHQILFALLSLSFLAHAQDLWTKGEVIFKDGTAQSGEIQDRQWLVNPTEIEFRTSTGEVKLYKPADIKEFSTSRPVRFRSVFAVYDGDAQASSNYPPGPKPQVVIKEQSFLEVLVDAPLALYYLLDQRGRKHFFIDDSNNLTELVDRWYGTGQGTRHYEFYKQQLMLITNDCPKLQSTVIKTSYNEQRLVAFFKKLNECKGFTVAKREDLPAPERKRTTFGLLSQVFFSDVTYKYFYSGPSSPLGPVAGISDFFLHESPMSSPNLGFGAFAEFYDRKRPNRLSLFNELGYQRVSQEYVSYQAASLLIAVRISVPEKSGDRHYFMFGVNNLYKLNTIIKDLPHNSGDDEVPNEYSLGGALGIGKSFSFGLALRTNVEMRYTYDVLHSGSTGFDRAHNVGLSLQFYKRR